MKYITQWYCRGCKSVKPRADFPTHIDANTRCLECQRGRDTSPSDSTSTPEQPAFVRRSFNPKRGKDNRE